MAAFLSPEEIAYQMTNIGDNRGPEIVASTVILAVLATLAVILRLACRRITRIAISWDDYLTLIGLMFWAFAMAFIKVSILLFYRRLFPSEATTKVWRMCNLALMVASVAFCLISVFGSGFACTPVAYIWDTTIRGGHCINLIALARFTCITGFVTDILILTLPIPIVWGMHLNRSKKIAVSGVFLLGSFVCVASIIRFYCLEQISRNDPTWGNVNSGIWTTVESSIGIISACLPIMAPILRTKVVAVSTSVFRSKKLSQTSNTFTNPSAANEHKEKKGWARLVGAGAQDTGSEKQRSDGDEEMG
ncbi:MAG: hypothetical protein Q9221_005788 [Calogaya cf. arnoldii]